MQFLGGGGQKLLENIVLMPMELLGLQSIYPNTFSLVHNGGTWFISCILICYIVFPFAVGQIKQIQTMTKILLMLFCVGILLYSPIVVWKLELGSIYSNPYFRLMEFLVGMLLAALMPVVRENKIICKFLLKKISIVFECIAAICVITVASKLEIGSQNYMLYSWILLPTFILILPALAIVEWKKIENSRIILYLSEISYTFFLVQLFLWPIMTVLVRSLGIQAGIAKIFSSFLSCFLLAALIHELIEKPFKKRILHIYLIRKD